MKIKVIILLFVMLGFLNIYAHENLDIKVNKKEFLTKQELQYLNNNKQITLCLHPNIFPIDGYEDGKHTGMMGDIYLDISTRLDITFVPIVSQNYIELDKNIKNHKCKLISIMPTKNKYSSYFTMTKPFFSTFFTLISSVDKSFVQNPEDLKGKKLLVRFDAHKYKILKYYPYLDIEVLGDLDTIMNKVLNNEAFAVVSVNESSDYLIDEYGYGKLKINGFLSKENLVNGSVGITKDDIVLYNIMQKVLVYFPKQKIDDITKNWRLSSYNTEIDYVLIIKILLLVGIIFAVMVYYQGKLKIANKKLAKNLDELTKKDKLLSVQSKQAVMGEMISMIAHQWRQPLSTITLQISNLQISRMLGEDVDKQKTDTTLEEISNNIIYLSKTIDDFKTYFHSDRKRTMIEMHELLNKTLDFVHTRVIDEGVSIQTLSSEKIYLDTHSNELIQVLLNIINNALDALAKSTKDDKTIKLHVNLTDTKILVYIEDNADGIESENMQRIFEPYFSTKDKNGTGLGLYMSQMIMQKQFNGDIDVISSSEGSVFTIEIPR